MPIDPHARRFLDMLAVANRTDSASPSATERRAAFANLMRFTQAPQASVRTEDHWIGVDGDLLVRVYSPEAAADEIRPGLLYCHGGGLVSGSVETHDTLCRTLAYGGDCRLIAVDYRLAPEHPFPAGLTDCRAAWTWIAAHVADLKLDPERIGIGGDSAGGTLAALLCQGLADDPGPAAAFQVLLCPITDFSARTDSRLQFGAGYLLDQAMMDQDIACYAPGLAPGDPRVSPLLRAGGFEHLPRALIHTAACDPLRDEGLAYATVLQAAGVAVSHTCHPGMIHLFYALTGILPYARAILPSIGAEIGAWARLRAA